MDIVEVNRKGHPCNPVRVERADMIEGDEIVGEKTIEESIGTPVKVSKKKTKKK